jgi:hypothetical protein
MTVTTNPCVVPAANAEEAMSIVRELRKRGLAQGYDFDFKWHPRKYDNYFDSSPAYVEFTFKDAKWATLFRIKYGGNT